MHPIYEEAKSLQEELVKYRRYFHAHPELGLEEFNTSDYIEKELVNMGYSPVRVTQTGLMVTCGGHTPGKTILLRGDMDALPIHEQTELSFKSENGNMHACGHDFHMAMLLGAAKLLKRHESEVKGLIKIMFQPAEENISGAQLMIDEGILENPTVDMALMIHLFPNLPLKAGTVLIPDPGPTTLAADWFTITVNGRGGHGAMPNTTVDPLNVASHIHIALQNLNARECPPTQMSVVTIGMMQGGDAGNVIPDTAVMKGTIRTQDEDNRAYIKRRLSEISKGIGLTFNADVQVDIIDGCPAIVCDKQVVESLQEAMSEVMPTDEWAMIHEYFDAGKVLFSEDFSYITERVPGAMLLLGAGHSEDGYNYPLHHPKVMFDESILYRGVAVHAYGALKYLSE